MWRSYSNQNINLLRYRQFVPHAGELFLEMKLNVKTLKVCPPCGELFQGQGEFKQSAKSLSPVRGVILVGVVIYFMCERFVPRTGSYSHLIFSFSEQEFRLSPVRGSYSGSFCQSTFIFKVCPSCRGVIPNKPNE